MSDAPQGGGDIKAALSRKLGPLPVGVWILAVGGGLVLTYYLRGTGGGGEEPAVEEGAPDTGGTGTGGWPYGQPNGVGQWDQDDDDDQDPGAGIATNEQWQRRAVGLLVGLGYDGLAVDRAIGKYLAGDSLTTVERSIVTETIVRLGPPPQSPPPPLKPDQPPPTTTPPTKPKPQPPTGGWWNKPPPIKVVRPPKWVSAAPRPGPIGTVVKPRIAYAAPIRNPTLPRMGHNLPT